MISKPKKSDGGTYTCQMKDTTLKLPGSVVVGLKQLTPDEFVLYIKNKKMYDEIYDINQNIIDTVKNNCTSWFNSNMNTDLIEDYYSNTLVYDKKHGDVIKLKFVDSESENIILNQKADIVIECKQLRFYKQKFVLECELKSFETHEFAMDSDDGENVAEDDEDIPCPNEEELAAIKKEYLQKVVEMQGAYNEKLKAFDGFSERFKTADFFGIAKVIAEFEDYAS